MLGKLKQFNSDVFNKTFQVPWNTTNLLGEPGSIMVYSLSPECPEGQSLGGNGYICGTFHILTMLYLNICVRMTNTLVFFFHNYVNCVTNVKEPGIYFSSSVLYSISRVTLASKGIKCVGTHRRNLFILK